MRRNRMIAATTFAACSAFSTAVDFTNVDVAGTAILISGWSSFNTIDTIDYFTPNAEVGDFEILRSGNLTAVYDAAATGSSSMNSVSIGINLVEACSGSGMVTFSEEVFELDAGGNEIAGAIGSITHAFNSSTASTWADTIVFSRRVERFRARKSFVLDATNDTAAFDRARLAVFSQTVSVVPEPTTMATLALGALALATRRRRHS